MPRGDGTGPPTERGQRGGRMKGNRPGTGLGGNCVCPGCGEKVPHRQGTPCNSINCPKCGTKMTIE
jgi:hypothetical protein